ncbi:hypothetical protein ACFW1F_01440 [Streptomyces bungoensis]|uniref:hypothetical protein n=1 Tax=Streptomyces bungoensis TaxID=285568 RepID=UPI0036A738B7
MLSSLVVAQDTGVPGPGFVELARHLELPVNNPDTYWEDELRGAAGFWSVHDPVLVLDSAIDRLMDELGAIKAAIQRLGDA